jgi:hypothetical protein
MNLAELEKKLIAAARANPPDEGIPYAFEKRILALATARPAADPTALWARALWRGAVVCLLLTLLFGALSLVLPRSHAAANDLSQEFEKTMLSAVNQDSDAVW